MPGSESTPNFDWRRLYLAVFLTSLAALLVELALTRIFSVIFYYHFAFLAISIAMFGLGIGGILAYALRGHLVLRLGWLACANAAATVAALAFLLDQRGEEGTFALVPVYLAAAAPFVLTGIILSSAIAATVERVGKVYFADLAGAAAGCLLLIPLLDRLGGPGAILAAAAVSAASAALWFECAGRRALHWLAVALALGLAVFAVRNHAARWLDVRYAKGARLPAEVWSSWNSLSRISVEPTDWGGHLIVIDRDASTAVCPLDLDHPSPDHLALARFSGPALPHIFKPGAKTLVIGAGGGYDVGRALLNGSRDITAVEINPLIANKVMRDVFRERGHNVFNRPEVRLFVEDGRSFVRRSSERYDIIQATLVDTWAATAAGAFALSENLLYTIEAFEDYLTRLAPGGILAFTRWGFEPPRESLRLVALAAQALKNAGVESPAGHIFIVRDGKDPAEGVLDTILVSRRPFTAADLARLRDAARVAQVEPVYSPDTRPDNAFTGLLTARAPEAFFAAQPYNVRPVSDDRPFFFYTVQPRDMLAYLRTASRASSDFKVNSAIPTLFGLGAISAAAVLLMLALPRLLVGARLRSTGRGGPFLLYFAAIGVAYILVQVALIQKLVLFLGHPTYALTAVIFTMLVSSGAGSGLSASIVRGSDRRLLRALAAVVGAAVLTGALAGPLSNALLALPLAARVAAAIVFVAPLGFLMGLPFPSGLARLEHIEKEWIRWAWALNAAASVAGSALSLIGALYLGLQATLWAGAALYAAAAAMLAASQAASARTSTFEAPVC